MPTAGSAPYSEPGYDEPERGQAGENHSFTDYAQAVKVKKTRSDAFLDGRSPK